MSQTKTGVLIVFERHIQLDDMVRSGTTLDAAVSSELLKNIFFVKAPMHDGAVIIRHGRILGAGCMLPLSKNVTRWWSSCRRKRAPSPWRWAVCSSAT